ncbi:DUF397 domain-containing protein [Streptomyces anulatus]|uniref:DUF397 domain-containing protein n=1 Tax=Streptomyces TaxID=1883 RepID=UPI00093EA27B|nr:MULTISPECIES: DUF397 domain-containing protein [unclassified Streptomyces]QNQ37845.1 DUF397 domain-containing protein [Streptomyces sp. CB00271]
MSDRPAPSTALPPSTAPPAPRWRRSSRSTGMNNCVETALFGGALLAVRDSKNVDRPPLRFSAAAWSTFVAGLGPHGADPRGTGPHRIS